MEDGLDNTMQDHSTKKVWQRRLLLNLYLQK